MTFFSIEGNVSHVHPCENCTDTYLQMFYNKSLYKELKRSVSHLKKLHALCDRAATLRRQLLGWVFV